MEGLLLLAVLHGGRCWLVVPGAGELDAMSSSSSLNLFLRDGPGRFRFAALILGRRGELMFASIWRCSQVVCGQ